MDKLVSLYGILKKLRTAGVKMKDIAEASGMSPSTLSSLYTSVLPSYEASLAQGVCADEALESALGQVNNISVRRLAESIDGLYAHVCELEGRLLAERVGGGTIPACIERAFYKGLPDANVYAGVYTGYSASFHSGGLKAEPYMITSVPCDDNSSNVYCLDINGNLLAGMGLFSHYQTGYMMFNEHKGAQLALKMACLRLPVMSFPHYIKGIYVNHDYNRNPVARRLLLVREGDEVPLDDFCKLKAAAIPKERLEGELLVYHDYTCGRGDVIKSMIFNSPGKDINDLVREKEMLGRM